MERLGRQWVKLANLLCRRFLFRLWWPRVWLRSLTEKTPEMLFRRLPEMRLLRHLSQPHFLRQLQCYLLELRWQA